MIVTQTDAGWQVINQQAHGLLAVQLALQWRLDKRPVHWEETLIALTEHDDGQDAWKGRNHLTKAGGPLHFQILEYSLDQCRNLIQIGLQKSRWNALMMSMHTTFLYEPKRGTDKALDSFLDQQIENQAAWRKQYKATKADATYAYAFLQWFDALSLILCLDQVPPEERRLEISIGPDGISYFIRQRTDGTLGVDPWPFEQSMFSVHVEVFQLAQLVFKDDKELYSEMHKSPIVLKEWTFKQ
ncbi:DUF3891 family protein [Spirosoma sp. KNUC1025]|uniref:DUF3891 family protein n=1 Tax=Spirosoma sp. KNUC1025 TaxID=2894082 RepID=UPI003864AFEF|nr:DUF3891 family protein [Spirosoma sp. KNUC1025]